MELKTFDEFEVKPLDEATISQWAKRAAATGAVAGATIGTLSAAGAGVASGGLALAIPLATWGAISMGINGLIGGALFAGGQARKDYKELKKLMKRIEKYQSVSKDTEVTPKKVAKFEQDIERATFLTHKLRTSLNSDLDIATSKGALRSDIKNSEKFVSDLAKMEKELKAISTATKRAKTLAAKKK